MKLPEFLTEGRYGDIQVKGHRVFLLHIVDDYNEGSTLDMIAEEYDTVPRDVLAAVVQFYLDNKAEVDAYVTQCHQEMERTYSTTPRKSSIEELQRRLEER
jgi:uncharacterized protein (DUF433 family)